jgi:hypothetical protein
LYGERRKSRSVTPGTEKTHSQRWHAGRHNSGSGHDYQGRFKFFAVQKSAASLGLETTLRPRGRPKKQATAPDKGS